MNEDLSSGSRDVSRGPSGGSRKRPESQRPIPDRDVLRGLPEHPSHISLSPSRAQVRSTRSPFLERGVPVHSSEDRRQCVVVVTTMTPTPVESVPLWFCFRTSFLPDRGLYPLTSLLNPSGSRPEVPVAPTRGPTSSVRGRCHSWSFGGDPDLRPQGLLVDDKLKSAPSGRTPTVVGLFRVSIHRCSPSGPSDPVLRPPSSHPAPDPLRRPFLPRHSCRRCAVLPTEDPGSWAV